MPMRGSILAAPFVVAIARRWKSGAAAGSAVKGLFRPERGAQWRVIPACEHGGDELAVDPKPGGALVAHENDAVVGGVGAPAPDRPGIHAGGDVFGNVVVGIAGGLGAVP